MTVRLVLDIEADAEPVSGWLEEPGRRRVAFSGVLELLAALEQALPRRVGESRVRLSTGLSPGRRMRCSEISVCSSARGSSGNSVP